MYQSHKTYIKPDLKMSDLLSENPKLLLLLEHLDIGFLVRDKTVSQVCDDNSIPLQLFLMLGNLYNGFHDYMKESVSHEYISVIIRFLKNSHSYYKTEKYPEIIGYINELEKKTKNEEVKLIGIFFNEYFNEVLEHLNYEDNIAFPYFLSLVSKDMNTVNTSFTAKEYRTHHTDIETKLSDLKKLLLKHVNISNELILRRKLFFSLVELEFDLSTHALIEEKILLPLIAGIEKGTYHG